jgi:hypothetical protein
MKCGGSVALAPIIASDRRGMAGSARVSDFYRACSTCKKPIAWNARYYACSVSTCQRNATNFAFCTVDCWDAHVPTFRHKDAWAEERRSPASAEAAARLPLESPKKEPSMNEEQQKQEAPSEDVLIVASKLKAYIRAKSGMNTSASVIDALSGKVRKLADMAIAKAQSDGRKTVMDRDFD